MLVSVLRALVGLGLFVIALRNNESFLEIIMTHDVVIPSVGSTPRPRLVAYQVEANGCPLVPGVQDRD